MTHFAPYIVRLFDFWKCGAKAYAHELGSTKVDEVTCQKCLEKLGIEKTLYCINGCGNVLGTDNGGCLLCNKDKVTCSCCGWCQECNDQAAYLLEITNE
ncbi:hypothetical protein CCP1ISM_3740002 [Azospirillaceae bacterium]